MAIEKVKRVEIIGLEKHKEKTLDYLHSLGVMHISTQDVLDNRHNLSKTSSLEKSSRVARSLLTLKRFEEILRPFVKKTPKVYQKDATFEQEHKRFFVLKKNLHSAEALHNEYLQLQERIDYLEKKRAILAPIPFNITRQSLETTYAKLILCKGEHTHLPGTTQIKKGYTLVQCSAKDAKKHSFPHVVDLSSIEKSIASDGINDKREFAQATKRVQDIKKQLSACAQKFYVEILRLQESFSIFRERYEKTASMLATGKTFILQGYIPVRFLSRVDPPIPLHIHELSGEMDPPVKLKHPPYVKHFAFITKMFGLPTYGGIDPTIYLSIFIPLFFGFMFSDIGYGILVFLVASVLLYKGDSTRRILRDAGTVLAVCGISTIVFGALFGSFFGNLFGLTPLLFDPFQEAQTILIISLAVGLFHINLGLLLALKKNTLSVLSFWLLQLGAALLYFQAGMYAWLVLGLSLALFMYQHKAMGLMNITGFVGTWFSYARLLALALATGGIALGINIIGGLVGNLPHIGSVLLVIVLIFGHLFNFALNILGSSIHSVRLHYIEFFSQFYETGGKPFITFRTKKVQEDF